MNTFRPTLIAAAAVAAIAAGAMGLMTFRGETHEVDSGAVCAAAEWPLIPAECLEGAANRPVRIVADVASEEPRQAAASQLAMQARFDTAFQ
jgi:hypothetical protein